MSLLLLFGGGGGGPAAPVAIDLPTRATVVARASLTDIEGHASDIAIIERSSSVVVTNGDA